jgi:anti-sigma regulatory factor (Ser/Thr protein kinase)/ActR/RegA family two-component response regulator
VVSGSMSEAIVHSPKTALVVDSEPHVNRMLTHILSDEGWIVERVFDNNTVLARVADRPFPLIITGQKTSGKDDVDLFRKVKTVLPDVKMIILANENSPADVIAAMRAGVFTYFCGPYTRASLADIVRRAMEDVLWSDGIEILSATTSWVRLTARCDLTTASRLVEFLRAGTNIPEQDRDDIVSAFHEILMNAMEHGGRFDPSQYVDVSFVRTRHAMVCRVKDPGPGFSLEEIRHAAFDTSPQELRRQTALREQMGLRPGGYGVLLATRFCDEIFFSERGNDVLLVKYVGARSSSASGQFATAAASVREM